MTPPNFYLERLWDLEDFGGLKILHCGSGEWQLIGILTPAYVGLCDQKSTNLMSLFSILAMSSLSSLLNYSSITFVGLLRGKYNFIATDKMDQFHSVKQTAKKEQFPNYDVADFWYVGLSNCVSFH